MILEEGNIRINFQNALDGFKFDDSDRTSTKFHGLSHCMKAVDFVVELNDSYLFVEIKDFHNSDQYTDSAKLSNLVKVLVTKFRDSFIYRWAENKNDKPIKYLCLMELENASISRLMKELKRQLPEKGPKNRWQQPIAATCVVANINRWNASFPDWPVSRLKAGGA